jgi:hypothetical protein
MLRASASGIMFVPHIMPPAPQDSRSDAARKRFGNVSRVVHIGGSRGHLRALRGQVLSSSFPALPRSFLTCAAWSFLRDHLTPRPAVAKSIYRFCIRKIRCAPALQNSCKGGGATIPVAGAGRSRLGKHGSSRHPESGCGSWPQSAVSINPSHLTPLVAPSMRDACGF